MRKTERILPVSLAICGLALALSSQAGAFQMLDDEAQGDFALGGVISVPDPAALDVKLIFCADRKDNPSQYYLLHLAGHTASFAKVVGGQTIPLGVGGEIPVPTKDQKVSFALHRDDWRMAFIWDRRVVAKAYDSQLHGSAVGHETTAAAKVDDAWLQQVGEIDKADYFEREEGAKDEWEHLTGSWQHISLREDRQAGQMQADKSTNAFSYYGTAEPAGLTTMGSWYWRNVDLSMATRARGQEGAVGLAFYAQDKDNYLLLRWDNRFSSAPGGPALRLLSVLDGKPQTIAQHPGGFFPDQWYQLEVKVCDDQVFCLIDGEPALQATTPLFGQGKIGLYVEGKQGAWFDDVHVVGWADMLEDFAADSPGKWLAAQGQWQLAQGAAKPKTNDPSLFTSGSADWTGYSFAAQATDGGGGVGLAVCCKGPQDAYIFRWAGRRAKVPYAGKAQLVKLSPEGPTVLSEAPLPADLSPSGAAMVVTEADYIAGLLGGRRVVDAVIPAPAAGGVGLYAEGTRSAAFQRLRMEPLPKRSMARVTKEFTDTTEHFEMVEWASTRNAWVKPADADSPKIWWTKGDYYGPLQLQFTIKLLGAVEGTMQVTLETEKTDPSKGEKLTITATRGSKKLSLKLTQDAKELGSAEIEAATDTCPMSFERRGRFLVVTADGKIALSVQG